MPDGNKKYSIRNTARGIRGVNAVTGYRDLAPGELVENVELTEAEYDSAKSTGYFAFGSEAKKEPEAAEPEATPPAPTAPVAPVPPADDLDNMADDDLRNTVQAITGKPAPAKATREQLLKLARGQD